MLILRVMWTARTARYKQMFHCYLLQVQDSSQIKIKIQNEERLYYNELKTTQHYYELKVIRLRINKLKQRLAALEGEPPNSILPFM